MNLFFRNNYKVTYWSNELINQLKNFKVRSKKRNHKKKSKEKINNFFHSCYEKICYCKNTT